MPSLGTLGFRIYWCYRLVINRHHCEWAQRQKLLPWIKVITKFCLYLRTIITCTSRSTLSVYNCPAVRTQWTTPVNHILILHISLNLLLLNCLLLFFTHSELEFLAKFHLSLTSSYFHPLQVENCDSNSLLVVDEDDDGKFRLEGVRWREICLFLKNRHLANWMTLLTGHL